MIRQIHRESPPPPQVRPYLKGWVNRLRLPCALGAAAMLLTACPSPSGGNGSGGNGANGDSGGGGGSRTYTAKVTGTVQDSAGAKLPGVTVSTSTTPPVTATTGPNGAFSLQVTHTGSSAFTLTAAKTCYETAPAKSITLTSNDPYDTGVTTLSLKPEPTTDDDRYTFTQKPDGSYKLTVNCVTEIPASKFSTFNAPAVGLTQSPILQRLATESGKAINEVLTEIELPPTLKTIGRTSFYQNEEVTGNFTIPRSVETIGDFAFDQLGSNHLTGTSSGNIASSRLPAITFETGSKLTSIGQRAFANSGSKVALALPEGLTTIGAQAFKQFITPAGDLVIPANVSSIGERAFSAFAGINDGVTIRSVKLEKVGANSPLGNNLFSVPGSGTDPRKSTITTIKLPAAVYNSYLNTSSSPRSDLDAIFGSEVTTYQDLEGNTL